MCIPKITAVTVTYNRTRTLKRCLDAILSQTHRVDSIVVVDNHSSVEERKTLETLVLRDDRIHLEILSENRGGAGGFEAGMRLAREKYPADWYWLMDDDAYPRTDCLERLLAAKEIIQQKVPEDNIGFLAPLIYGIDRQKYQLFHHKRLSRLIYRNIPIAKSAGELKDIHELEADAFVGPLISAAAVERHGVADGSLFIYGDDTEYTYRVTRDMPSYLIKAAVIEHQDAPVLDDNMSAKGWWKEYYGNRNQFFFIREFKKSLMARYVGYFLLSLRLFAIMIKSIMKGYHRLRICLIWKAICDGLQNRRGKQIDPAAYMRYLEENNIK